jgi:hypothetical protein
MTPEISKGLSDLLTVVFAGASTLITAAVGYGVWKIREMQKDKKAYSEMSANRDATRVLTQAVSDAVANTRQTMKLTFPLDPEIKKEARRKALGVALEAIPPGIRDRLTEMYGSATLLNQAILLRIEAEVGRQQPKVNPT